MQHLVSAYVRLAGLYDRNQEFEKTMGVLRQRAAIEPDNPEAFYTIATYYWRQAYRGAGLSDEEKGGLIVLGLTAVDSALELNGDYMEALVYKNILMRMQANLTEDGEQWTRLIAEADRLRAGALLAGRER